MNPYKFIVIMLIKTILGQNMLAMKEEEEEATKLVFGMMIGMRLAALEEDSLEFSVLLNIRI